jgi:hypothetical protein
MNKSGISVWGCSGGGKELVISLRRSILRANVQDMTPRYAVCRGGAHDNERWPLSRDVGPGHQFSWGNRNDISGSRYAVEAEIIQTNLGPMWVAVPA